MAKKSIQPEQLSAESQMLFDVLNNSDDLACIIVGASFLDVALESLLWERFVNIEFGKRLIGGPLGSYSAKVDLTYCLGLISNHTHADLCRIGKIRNKAAHSHFHLTFEDKEIQSECSDLKKWKIISKWGQYRQKRDEARDQFAISVALINQWLLVLALSEKSKKK